MLFTKAFTYNSITVVVVIIGFHLNACEGASRMRKYPVEKKCRLCGPTSKIFTECKTCKAEVCYNPNPLRGACISGTALEGECVKCRLQGFKTKTTPTAEKASKKPNQYAQRSKGATKLQEYPVEKKCRLCKCPSTIFTQCKTCEGEVCYNPNPNLVACIRGTAMEGECTKCHLEGIRSKTSTNDRESEQDSRQETKPICPEAAEATEHIRSRSRIARYSRKGSSDNESDTQQTVQEQIEETRKKLEAFYQIHNPTFWPERFRKRNCGEDMGDLAKSYILPDNRLDELNRKLWEKYGHDLNKMT